MQQDFFDKYKDMLKDGKNHSIFMEGFSFRDNVDRLLYHTLSFYEVNGENFAFFSLGANDNHVRGYQIAEGEFKKMEGVVVPEFGAHVVDLFSEKRTISIVLDSVIANSKGMTTGVGKHNFKILAMLFTNSIVEDYLSDLRERDWVVPEFNLIHILRLVEILIGSHWQEVYLNMDVNERTELKAMACSYINLAANNTFLLPF